MLSLSLEMGFALMIQRQCRSYMLKFRLGSSRMVVHGD